MKVVHKFPLSGPGRNELRVEPGAAFVALQLQRGVPTLWALVDPQAAPKSRVVWLVATGEADVDLSGLTYVGTVQLNDTDGIVFHAFDAGPL